MRTTAWLLLLVCGACDSSGQTTAVVRDSASIRIVESSHPAWHDGQRWLISPHPSLSLGAQDADGPLSLDRLSGAWILDSERIAVLDEGASEIRFFTHDGTPISAFGRRGEGPGEFLDLKYIGFHADSLWVLDGRQQRLTAVDPRTGGFRVARVAMQNAQLSPVGILAEGDLVLAADLAFSQAILDELPAGLHRFRSAYVRVDPSGAITDTLLVAPGTERILTYAPQGVQMLRPLAPRATSHGVRGSDLVVGSQELYEFGVHSPDGTPSTLIRRLDVDVRLDPASYRTAVENRIHAAPEPARPGLRNLYEQQPVPESRPAYDRLIVDSEDFIWVQEWDYSSDSGSWSVFSPNGVWLGVVEFPDHFRPTQILEGQVVGVWRDEVDVEYVRIHELTRSSSPPDPINLIR